MIVSDDVSDGGNIDDRMECDEDYVEIRAGDRVQKVLHWMVIAAMNWRQLIVIFIGKDKTKQSKVKCSTHIRCRWQNILSKLSEGVGQARKATVDFETWHCLITNHTLDNIVQHTY